RREQRIAADPGVSRGSLGEAPIDDDPDVGRGAADIEGDQALFALSALGQRTAPRTAENPRRWPREEGQDRAPRDGRRGHDAAIGAHDMQFGGKALLTEARVKPGDI